MNHFERSLVWEPECFQVNILLRPAVNSLHLLLSEILREGANGFFRQLCYSSLSIMINLLYLDKWPLRPHVSRKLDSEHIPDRDRAFVGNFRQLTD